LLGPILNWASPLRATVSGFVAGYGEDLILILGRDLDFYQTKVFSGNG